MFVPPPPRPEGTPKETSQHDTDDAFYRAADLVRNGLSPKKARQKLVEEGHTPEEARALVEEVLQQPPVPSKREIREIAHALKQAGQRNILIGALVCVVGIIITLVTLSAASGPGGGRYVVAWGAVVFGGIQFFRGISQISQSQQLNR